MKTGNAPLMHRARTLAACSMLVLTLGGCAGGMYENVLVTLHPYEAGAARAGVAASGAAVLVEPVRDARRGAVGSMIGERTTIGAVSMGSIEMEPVPTAVMAQVLKAELKGMGFTIVDSGGEVRVGAQLTKFQVATPATPIYWDMNGTVELDVTATGRGGRKHVAQYAAKCTDRTYVFPSQELITNVVSACVREIGAKIRGDAALADFLRAG